MLLPQEDLQVRQTQWQMCSVRQIKQKLAQHQRQLCKALSIMQGTTCRYLML